MPTSEVHNCDCLELMRQLPDNYFDLCVTDPPFGDACSQIRNVERERENKAQYNRFGNPGSRFERYKRDTDKERTFDSRMAPGATPSGEPKRGGG